MTALSRTPQNTNLLQPTKYILTFDRAGSVPYFCQSVNIPGVSVGQAPINFPSVTVYSPGNQIAYNNLNVVFLVDEAVESWQGIYNWFRSFASPDGTDERNSRTQMQNQYVVPTNQNRSKLSYADATLTILNNLNNPVVRIQFTNVFPVSLSDIIFDTKLSADDIITADATFVYDEFKFIPV